MTKVNVRKEDAVEYITYDRALELAKEEVEHALSRSPSVIREYTSHLIGSRGKFIRAVSLLTCARMQAQSDDAVNDQPRNKQDLVHPNAVKSAAAIELLHLATLVHDDVIDDADTRRGNPTLHKKFGKKTAVICGDYLFSIALKIASSVSNRQDYLNIDSPDYIARVCFGELSQHINNGNFDLSVYRYLKIISGKTAALFEASFHAGAVLSGCSSADISTYRRLGRYVGMIFQLIDDCMDFEATEGVARKPVQSDFEQNVVTLPMIHALKNMPDLKENARMHGRAVGGANDRPGKDEVTRNQINEAVRNTGGLTYTRLIAKKYYNKYIKTMNKLDITKEKRKGLQAILDKAFRVF
jgi:heptaprenyl diphosphate synthase